MRKPGLVLGHILMKLRKNRYKANQDHWEILPLANNTQNGL